MSYHIYTTEGIILKRSNFGEANVVLHVLTQDLGLIIASARSARLSVSKLSAHLQEYSLVLLSCVKGKNGWKVTNAAGIESFYFDYPAYSHAVLAKVSTLLLKMIVGEDRHPEIFETIKSGFLYLQNIEEQQIPDFETIIVLRILFELGYLARSSDTEDFLTPTTGWGSELLLRAKERKTLLVRLINEALKASQL